MTSSPSPSRRPPAPHVVLGVPPHADDDAIRAAYVRAVKAHPPDRSPEAFERVRDAYEALRDPRARARQLVFGVDPFPPFVSLMESAAPRRPYVGPGPWRALLEKGRRA